MQTESILSEGRWALLALQTGAALVVLAALPYPLFQLDRYTFVKELVLLAAALAAVLLCIGSARKLTVFMVDALVAGFLALSLLSALFAANGWLAARALGVSLAGAGLFWAARTVARAGYGPRLLAGIAAAVVVGAATGLIQAYGLVTSDLASSSRAPGGTFGNRNFMAHLVAIGLPVLILVTVQARRRRDFALGTAGVALAAAALVLSRSRAGWLGAAACGTFLAVEGLWVGRLWADQQLRRRVLLLAGVANYKEGSGRGRLIQYRNTLRMVADHPVLGVGPGNWPVHYPKYLSPGDPSFDAEDIIPTNPWPSSDWMATLAERGFPASLLLLLVGGTIALGAWARVRSGTRREPALGDLTIVATLIAIVVVGAFDAVLLLPAPTFFAWTVVGALASSARPIREVALSSRGRRRLTVSVAIVGGVLLAHSLSQVVAIALSNGGSREALEIAARVDPGSYRIHMLLAQKWRAAGRCQRAFPHAQRAQELFPNHPAPRVVFLACRGNR